MASSKVKGFESVYAPWTHCLHHLPAVCQTKLSPCIILQWQSEEMAVPKNVVVDLITGLPVPENDTLGIYHNNLTSLMKEKPAGWQRVVESHCSRDRIIPDDMEEIKNKKYSKSLTNFTSIKLMSWGPGENYQIRPGQTVEVQQFFDDPKLREAYLVLKWIIKTFSMDVSSYMLKKALLGSSTYRMEGLSRWGIVKNAMLTSELEPVMSRKVKHSALNNDEDIPLL